MNGLSFKCVVMLAFVVSACQNESDILPVSDRQEGIDEQAVEKLSPDEMELSVQDAATVAKLFVNSSSNSRSVFGGEVKNVKTIFDDSNTPVFYAVNFANGGYIIISATKHSTPILAVVPEGEFVSNDGLPSNARDIVLQELKESVQFSRNEERPDSIVKQWRAFEKSNAISEDRSGSRAISDDLYWEQEDRVAYLQKQGYVTYYLSRGKPEEMPQDIYDRFVQRATEDDQWAGTDDNGINAGIIAVRYKYQDFVAPKMTTNWVQSSLYKSNFVDPSVEIGCVTIAVGQIMRYYEHPKDYSWKDMKDALYGNEKCETLSRFLWGLRQELKVTDDGRASWDNATAVLKRYGYRTSISSNLNGRETFPLITNGHEPGVFEGHTWVIDGKDELINMAEYALYIPRPEGYPDEFWYFEAMKESVIYSHTLYHYMNFGQIHSENGWYVNSNFMHANGYPSHIKYTTQRQYMNVVL